MKNTQIETRFVVVYGDAEVLAAPDEIVVAFGAEALCQELNLNLGQTLSIEEERSGVRLWNRSWWGAHHGASYSQNRAILRDGGELESGASIAPGQIAVRATVKVRFEIS